MNHVDVVDLDCTLVSVNTFPRWVSFLAFRAFLRRDTQQAATIVCWVIARRLRLMSHNDLKRRIINLPVLPAEAPRFANRLRKYFCADIVERVEGSTAAHRVLATAAPKSYVPAIVDELGLKFDAVLAANTDGDRYIAMSGQAKLHAVTSYLDARFGSDGYVYSLYTDHEDDLPLAQGAARVVLCNALTKSRNSYEAAGIITETANSTTATGRNVLQPYDLSEEGSFNEACDELYASAVSSYGVPDLVVGIATAGVYIANRIETLQPDVQVLVVRRQRSSTPAKKRLLARLVSTLPSAVNWQLRRFESWLAEKRFARRSDESPTGAPVSYEGPRGQEQPESVLIVDDSVDSGETLRAVVAFITERYPTASIRTAVLATSFVRPGYNPDVVLRKRVMLRGPWSLDA